MTQSILTPTMVTREAARILHEKLSFIGTINRQYDSSYAQTGAKIGDSLRVRLPNEFVVRTGAAIAVREIEENISQVGYSTVTMATQKGVDTSFTSAELTLSLQDFSQRILDPAMATLASSIEADALSNMTKAVANTVATGGTYSLANILSARVKINQALGPKDNQRAVQADSTAMASMVDQLKALFHDSTAVSQQYREGMMGRTAGFDFYENERVGTVVIGSDRAGTLGAAAANGATTFNVAGFAAGQVLAKGTVLEVANVYNIHPETKVAYGTTPKQFVVTADTTMDGAGANAAVPIDPPVYWDAPAAPSSLAGRQNASAQPANGAAITIYGAVSTTPTYQVAYHKDAFCFVTADLEDVSQYGAWGAREVYDGISLRIARQYAISTDTVPCRIDVLYGYKAIRPSIACRLSSGAAS